MNRKNLIITISIGLIIIFGALGWYFYTRTTPTPTLTPVNGGLPFGQGGGNVSPGTPIENPSGTGLDSQGRPVARLFRITDQPSAGFISFIKNGSTVVRYVDRATGHIFDVNPVTLEKIQITNNTLPKIYEAYFKNDASGVIFRSLKDNSDVIMNTSLELIPPKATSTGELYTIQSGTLLGDLGDIQVAPDNTLAYTTNDTGAVVKSGFSGEKPVNLYSSAFTNWKINWFGQNILMTTKASANVPGYSYILNAKAGGLTKALGPLNGLSVSVNTSGKNIAYSFGSSLQTINLTTKVVSDITPATLGEKCTWSKRTENYLYCGVPVGGVGPNEPDSWYQGSTHFSDRIWRFNTDTGFNDMLVDPKKDFNINLDVENPALAPDEDYLIFRNKNDQTLWALKLN